MDCLSKADFGDRLKTLPDGLDTPLYKELDKNGVEVSGGEAQKIDIAGDKTAVYISQMTRSHISRICSRLWDTNSTVVPPLISSSIRALLFS